MDPCDPLAAHPRLSLPAQSNYPPAKPAALDCEPLKAATGARRAMSVALVAQVANAYLGLPLRQAVSVPSTTANWRGWPSLLAHPTGRRPGCT